MSLLSTTVLEVESSNRHYVVVDLQSVEWCLRKVNGAEERMKEDISSLCLVLDSRSQRALACRRRVGTSCCRLPGEDACSYTWTVVELGCQVASSQTIPSLSSWDEAGRAPDATKMMGMGVDEGIDWTRGCHDG